MDILKIILDETRLFADSFYREQEEQGVFDTPKTEGVGDKYLANRGIINDPDADYQRQTQPAVKASPEMGELVGYVEFPSYVKNPPQEPIYKNPVSLKNFEADVRAVTDAQGNLYVTQHDGKFMHEGFANIFHLGSQMQIYTITKFITWHRVGETNKFGLANSASTNLELIRTFDNDEELQEFFKILEAAQNKNSHFEFVPTIFYDVNRLEEGVGDKYLHNRNQGIFADLEKEYLKQTQGAVKQSPDMGQFAGYALDYLKKPLHDEPVYKNPTSLRNFEADVRAVSDKQGNIYVAQHKGRFTHDGFQKIMGTNDPMAVYDIKDFVTWQRIGNTNGFGLADSSAMYLDDDDKRISAEEFAVNHENLVKNFKAAQQKNPALDFEMEFYHDVIDAVNNVIREEIQLHEGSYYSDEGVIKLYHRVGTKNHTIETLPELIKSVEQQGLVTNDNGEIGSAIWFSNDISDYGENGIFVVALDFDTATNGVTNNKYGMVYEGHNAYAYENIPFEDLEIIKIPVGVIGRDHVLTSDKAIEYINKDKFFTPDAIRSGKFVFRPFVDAFQKYVQPFIGVQDFLAQTK